MRNPWEPRFGDLQTGTLTEQAEQIRRANVADWLSDHPTVPWSVDEMIRQIDRNGQQRAAADAIAEGRHAELERPTSN